jgi:L-asparagine transporter-like permease
LSTLALDGSDRAGAGATVILRQLDLILLALALPVFISADLPMLGYAVAAGAWIAQRLLLAYSQARVARSFAAGDRRAVFRTTAISGLGRVWLVSVAALLVGLFAEREDGLAAALLVTALFTVQLAVLAVGQRERPQA